MPRMLSEPRRIVISTDTVGGVWTYALDLARALADRGIEVVLMIVGPSASASQRRSVDAIGGVTPVVADLPLDWAARDERELVDAGEAFFNQCRAFDPDVIHLNSPGFAATLAREEAASRTPLVVGLHSCVASWWSAVFPGIDLPPDLAWQLAIVRRGLARADAVIVPSHAFAAAIKPHYGHGLDIEVIPNGRHLSNGGRRQAGAGGLVLTAGRLWDQGKNVATLDRAAAQLAMPIEAAGPVCEPRRGAVAAAFHHLRLVGELDRAAMQDRLDEAGIFVSAAIYEPFGLAVLEAAQARCALVLSDIPTFRELWDGAAVFVEPSDAYGFAREIERLRADGAARLAMADAAARRAGGFGVDAMATDTAALYGRVAACRLASVGAPA